MNKDKINKLQNFILDNNKEEIRLEKFNRDQKGKTLQSFLIRFFTDLNNNKDTIFKETKKIHTYSKKRRSLADIFLIVRYYYPETSLMELLNLLYNVLPNELSGFRSSYCGTIFKRVWYYDGDKQSVIHNKTTTDEFDMTVADYMGNDFDF